MTRLRTYNKRKVRAKARALRRRKRAIKALRYAQMYGMGARKLIDGYSQLGMSAAGATKAINRFRNRYKVMAS